MTFNIVYFFPITMKSKRDPSDLLANVFHKEYPLNNHTLSLVIGGSGSGKSYFCYNILTPIYLDHFDIYHLLICSKTAKCDATLSEALDKLEKDYPHVHIDIINLEELAEKCEQIRASAIKMQHLEELLKIAEMKPFQRYIDSKIEKQMNSMKNFSIIQSELYLFIEDLRELLELSNYEIRDINKTDNPADNEDTNSESEDYDEDKSEPDPAEYDINYTINFQGLGINKNVFTNDKYKPKIVIDWEQKDLNEEEYMKKAQDAVIKYIHKHILKPRYEEQAFGPKVQPILAIIDDNVGNAELSNPNSALTSLIYLRRHLHTSIFILSQSATGINTNIRRNANSFHLLPSLSEADLDLISFRLPAQVNKKDMKEQYIKNNKAEDRNQCMTNLFCVFPYNGIVSGCPDCVLNYYRKAQNE